MSDLERVPPEEEWDRMLDHAAGLVRMALAEAGYPDAHVYPEETGVFVEGVPAEVEERAFDLVNEWYERAGSDVVWINDKESAR